MDYETIRIEKIGAVERIILNRPQVRNAQNRVMLEELDNAFQSAASDTEVHVLILSGAGKDFSSGHDISAGEWKTGREIAWEQRYLECKQYYLDKMLEWRDLPRPLIAQVHGHCIMGGLMLAMVCDFIICSDDATFSSQSIRWGGSSEQYLALPWFTGVPIAKQFLFTGDTMDAATALRTGLVNAVVPPKDLASYTLDLAKRIALQDLFALRCAKQACNAMLDAQGQVEHLKKAFDLWAISALRPEILEQWDNQKDISVRERANQRDHKYKEG